MNGRWLALTGFMGAGKSTVGRRVAARLGATFVDADRAIEERAGQSIADIFGKRGELWFRRTEEAVIREIVLSEPRGVVALGGGALESAKTRDLLSRTAWVVWLAVSVEVAWRRAKGSSRPLAADRERFGRRAEAREGTYRAAADLMIDADQPTEHVASRVTAWAASRLREEEAS